MSATSAALDGIPKAMGQSPACDHLIEPYSPRPGIDPVFGRCVKCGQILTLDPSVPTTHSDVTQLLAHANTHLAQISASLKVLNQGLLAILVNLDPTKAAHVSTLAERLRTNLRDRLDVSSPTCT